MLFNRYKELRKTDAISETTPEKHTVMLIGMLLMRVQSWSLFDQHAPNALGKQSHAEIADINAIGLEMADAVKDSVTLATVCATMGVD